MKSLKFRPVFVLLAAVLFAQLLAGSEVWVFPSDPAAASVSVYNDEPFRFLRSAGVPQDRSRQFFETPAGDKVYYVSSTGDMLHIYTADFSREIRSFPLTLGATAAAITPDGRRFLVLSGGLRIFDTSTDGEIGPVGGVSVGGSPIDVAVSLDSTQAYVLNRSDRTLVAVDLASKTVAGSPLTLSAEPSNVAVGPNGLIYVSCSLHILEVDPTTLTIRGDIPVTGYPTKLQFTPDGTKAVALNRGVSVSGWVIMANLANRSALGPIPYSFVDTPDNLILAGNDWVYATSSSSGSLYRITFNPVQMQYAAVTPIGNPSGVTAAVASNEAPLARYVFFTDANNLYRVDQALSNVSAQAGLNNPVGRLLYFGGANSAAPANVQKLNDNQSLTPGAISAPLVVRVVDNVGKPIYNTLVTWSAGAGGPALQAVNTWTNVDGLAQTVATAPSTTGAYQMVARIGSTGAMQTVFTVNVATRGPGTTMGISMYSGNGQIVAGGATTDYPLVVQVLGNDGKPVPNVDVTWTVVNGGGVNAAVSTTDGNGLASISFYGAQVDFSVSYIKSQVTATTANYGSVTFVVTSIPSGYTQVPILELITPAIAGRNITAKLGQTLAGAVVTRATVGGGPQMGSFLSDIGLFIPQDPTIWDPTTGPVAACSGGTVLSGADGKATCDLVVTGRPGSRMIRAHFGGASGWDLLLTATVGDPGKVAIIRGDGQSGSPGQTLPVDLLAEISDGYGNILPGTQVVWDVLPASAATLSNAVTVADGSGRVSARVKLGGTAGTFQVRVRTTTGTGLGMFSETVVISLSAPTKVSGDNPVQTAIINQQFAQPLVVQVSDTHGNPAPSIPVAWAVTAGSATLTNYSTVTDTQGQTSVSVTAGATPGTITVTATINTTTLTFTLTALPPGPVVVAAGFLNGAGFQPGVTPGGIVTIQGTGLAPGINGVVVANTIIGPLPLKLAGVEVTFGATPAPIYHVANINGKEQITVQAPFELGAPGVVAVKITVNGSSTVVNNVPVVPYQPGLFETTDSNGNRYAVMLHDDGSFVTPLAPARRGEVVRMFVTGLGQTSPATGTGRAGVSGQTVLAQLIVGVNNGGVRVVSAEYMAGAVGVYVITFQVPADSTTGANRPLALAVASPDGTSLLFGNPSNFAIQ